MLQEVGSICSDVSILRRLSFAAASIPEDTPRYWEFETKFGFKSSFKTPSAEQVKVILESVKYIDEDAFATDHHLLVEFCSLKGFHGHVVLGIVLISCNNTCKLCGGTLLVRSDRPSFPVVYSNDLGTTVATHFRKYCQNNCKGCTFTQHYGFHTSGSDPEVVYDNDCLELRYFLSSHVTAFKTKMLSCLSAEMLLGQISYQQRSDIINYSHGYDSAAKKNMSTMCASSDDAETSRYT